MQPMFPRIQVECDVQYSYCGEIGITGYASKAIRILVEKEFFNIIVRMILFK